VAEKSRDVSQRSRATLHVVEKFAWHRSIDRVRSSIHFLPRDAMRFWANFGLHCMLWTVPAANAIHLAATDHGEFITLVAGKRPSLSMARNNDDVYDKKPQRYAEDSVMHW